MDIEKLTYFIKDFALKHNFVLNSDIETIENTTIFNYADYKAIDHKNFISLDNFKEKIELSIGKIEIEIDEIDEEEWFTLEKNKYFIVNPFDFLTEESLYEEIIEKCKKYHLIN